MATKPGQGASLYSVFFEPANKENSGGASTQQHAHIAAPVVATAAAEPHPPQAVQLQVVIHKLT